MLGIALHHGWKSIIAEAMLGIELLWWELIAGATARARTTARVGVNIAGAN